MRVSVFAMILGATSAAVAYSNDVNRGGSGSVAARQGAAISSIEARGISSLRKKPTVKAKLGTGSTKKPIAKPKLPPPRIPNLAFQCKNAKETCNTMYYGIYCGGKGNIFTFDKVSEVTKEARRIKAGCRPDNRYSKDPYGLDWSCDEFPFASVREANNGDQFNRCVNKEANNSQGCLLAGFYKSKSRGCADKKGCKFTISFTGGSNYQYCKTAHNYNPDGNIFTKDDGAVNRESQQEEARHFGQGGMYQLASGETIYSPQDLEIGSITTCAVIRNETLAAELNSEASSFPHEFVEEDIASNYDFVDGEVVAKL